MRTHPPKSKGVFGFTRIDLVVLIAFIVVLTGTLLPALAASKGRSAATGCLANLRQLQIGWAMYMHDNNDVMVPNSPSGGGQMEPEWCPTGVESWSASPAPDINTNSAAYTNTVFFPYYRSVSVLKCPADVVPAANGPRLRSYSMNSKMGTIFTGNLDDPGYRVYARGSDLTCPTPANAFVFLDEHPDSINDGFFQVSIGSRSWPNVPASYLEGGCGFSFADSHAEIHLWQTSTLLIPIRKAILSSVPATFTNGDWIWYSAKAACAE